MEYIIIHDEEASLQKFAKQLTSFELPIEMKQFTVHDDVIAHIMQAEPSCVIIDPTMFGRTGLRLIKEIKKTMPHIHIVIVSHVSDYAVEAFELEVIDYIKLPTNQTRIQNMLEWMVKPGQSPKKENIVCAFNELSFELEDTSLGKQVKWRTKKARELFAYLLYKKDEHTRKDMLVDLLWPEVNWQQGITLLYSNMYHVRKLLESLDLNIEIVNMENYYMLKLNDVSYDVEAWEIAMEELPILSDETVEGYEQLIYDYKGDFLGKEHYEWAYLERQRLQMKWLRLIDRLTGFYMKAKKYTELKRIYYYMLKTCPDLEDGYYYLMKVLARRDEHKRVSEMYATLESMTKEEYGVQPQAYITNWYDEWINEK